MTRGVPQGRFRRIRRALCAAVLAQVLCWGSLLPAGADDVEVVAFNPTPWARTQWVLYGSTDAHDVVWSLPRTSINVGRVAVPPWFHGKVDVMPDLTDDEFALGPFVEEAVMHGIEPYIIMNGQKEVFTHWTLLADHHRVKVFLLQARTASGYAELILYVFHRQNIVRYELSVFCESKTAPRIPMTASFGFNGHATFWNFMRRADPAHLISVAEMSDGQGRRFQGSLIFHSPEFVAKPDKSPEELAEFHSWFGEAEYPLYVLHPWKEWGVWRAAPPAVTEPQLMSVWRDKIAKPFHLPFGHFGYLENRRPGDTGDQAGFGTWQHVETVGAGSAANMFLDQLITAQEACRPTHFFESGPAGGFRIVRASDHPSWVTWDEGTHYHTGVSPDRLGRTFNYTEGVGGWYGHDYQHYGCLWLAEDVLLNGSMASFRQLLHKREKLLAGLTLPSVKPGWSTNSALVGRAGGRTFLGIANLYLATGDEAILDRAIARIHECFLEQWPGKTIVTGSIRPSRIIWNDARIIADGAGWVVWEDSLAVKGLDALANVCETAGRSAAAATIRELAWKIGRSVVMHGFHPTLPKIAWAIRWDPARDGVPWPAASYDNPYYVVYPTSSGFNTWAIACLQVTLREAKARGDAAVEARAASLLGTFLPGASTDLYGMRFVGAK